MRSTVRKSALPKHMAQAVGSNLPHELRGQLAEAVRILVEQAHPQRIILFGSWAKRHARTDSDVDLLVVADTQHHRMRLTEELYRALLPVFGSREFDLLVFSPSSWEEARHLRGFVSREADRDGVTLYEAT